MLVPKPEPIPELASSAKKAGSERTARNEESGSPFMITVGHVYDGPMDLLLDLIRKQNLDIYDIPIAKITAQFLEYTDTCRIRMWMRRGSLSTRRHC